MKDDDVNDDGDDDVGFMLKNIKNEDDDLDL